MLREQQEQSLRYSYGVWCFQRWRRDLRYAIRLKKKDHIEKIIANNTSYKGEYSFFLYLRVPNVILHLQFNFFPVHFDRTSRLKLLPAKNSSTVASFLLALTRTFNIVWMNLIGRWSISEVGAENFSSFDIRHPLLLVVSNKLLQTLAFVIPFDHILSPFSCLLKVSHAMQLNMYYWLFCPMVVFVNGITLYLTYVVAIADQTKNLLL